MVGIWRIHYILSEALQLLVEKRYEHGTGLSIQLLKAISQVATDGGSWQNAMWLVPLEDPIGTEDFGGDEAEIEEIYAYKKALLELKVQGSGSGRDTNKDEFWWNPKTKQWEKKTKGKGKGKTAEGGEKGED